MVIMLIVNNASINGRRIKYNTIETEDWFLSKDPLRNLQLAR